MKRKIIATTMALVMVAVCVLSLSNIAKAGNYTYTGQGNYDGGTPTMVGDDPNVPPNTDINVQARVKGGPAIKYDITITWNAMQFEYNYGKEWNPTTHKYEGLSAAGWTIDPYVTGANTHNTDGSVATTVNNGIHIYNASNWPVDVDFSYAHNDPNPFGNSTSNPVTGIFNKTNTNLAKDVVAGNPTQGGSETSYEMHLNMDYSDASVTDYYLSLIHI